MEENIPLSSDEENSARNITLEHVIKECGAFGRYQYIHFFFLSLFPVATGIYNFYYVFGAANTPYECLVPANIQRNFSIEISQSQCHYVVKNQRNETIRMETCTSWKYDRSIFGKTFVEEVNIVCEQSVRRSLLAMVFQSGGMVIFFTGQIADLIGRRRLIQLLFTLLLVTSVITQTLLQFVAMPINVKFALVLVGQFVAGIDTYVASLILLIELTTSAYITFAGNLALVAFTVGEIVVTIMAYMCRDWLRLKWAMSFYIFAMIPYLYYIPESPHWLLTKHRYEELKQLLQRIARWNQRSESQWLTFYDCLVDKHRKEKNIRKDKTVAISPWTKISRFLTHIPTMSKLLISGVLGFVTLFLFYKIAYGLGAMEDINPYGNIIIGAHVEALGYIVPSLLMVKYGRKPILITFLLLTALCLFLTPFISHSSRLIIIIISQIGKFAISGSNGILYIFVPELFPTTIRGTGMGCFSLFSRIGSTAAPAIDASISHNHTLTTYAYYLYAICIIVCIVLTLLLPETRNIPLADNIDYNKKKSSNA